MAMSRFEEILQAIVNEEECDLTPQSRAEVLLLALLNAIQSDNEIINGVKKSKYKPTASSKLGDMVYRENPVPGMNIGWIYTTEGWVAFGKIPNDNSELTDPSDNDRVIYNWTHQVNPDNSEDFTAGFYWGIEETDGSITKKHKSDLASNMVKLSNVNGYSDSLLYDGVTADTNVFVLGNTPSTNNASPNRKYSINWDLTAVSGNLVKDDFKAIIEMDMALLTPTESTNRPSSGYDVFEIDFYESATGHHPYLGLLDDRKKGQLRTSGNEDKNGTTSNWLYRYLGHFPLDTFVTLRFEVDGMNRISTYIDGCLIDDDLNNPFWNDSTPDTENLCSFNINFGDFDYVVCREIRVMNLNPSKTTDVTA